MSHSDISVAPPSYQAAVFSTGRHNAPPADAEKVKTQTTVTEVAGNGGSNPSSGKGSPASSIRGVDMEKADPSLEDEDKALASYLVPTLPKGVKTARAEPASWLLRFRVWYNYYRMVRDIWEPTMSRS